LQARASPPSHGVGAWEALEPSRVVHARKFQQLASPSIVRLELLHQRGAEGGGFDVVERARFGIGADGRNSRVAKCSGSER